MSTDQVYISKPKAPRTSVDFDALYKEGISHIESLSSQLWTDYNAHDPGITMLEILCYAITELGYRSDFAIGDIIEPASALLHEEFFTLSEVASNAPLNTSDFRKYLIDQEGIRNAWLERLLQPDPRLYCGGTPEEPKLIFNPLGGETPVDIRGLYDVFVQFEEDPEYGDLNDNSLNAFFELTLVGEGPDGGPNTVLFEAEIEFPIWEEIGLEIDSIIDESLPYKVELKNDLLGQNPDESNVFEFTLVLNRNSRPLELGLTMRIVSGMERVLNFNDFKSKLKATLNDPNNQFPAIVSPDPWLIALLQRFMGRRKQIRALLEVVRQRLAERRNLCEDFQGIYPMSLKEIGLELDLVVESGRNLEEILAQVYDKTEIYLSPPIIFYSLREMLEKDYRPEEIFRGPVLNNGFIDEQDLSFQERRSTLYTSDLIQEFMKIDGVEKVDHIALYCYNQGILERAEGATECLVLNNPERYLPRLNHTRSEIRMDDRSGKYKQPDRLAALDILGELKALRTLKGAPGRAGFSIPEGTYRGLDEYYSIQHEFPLAYAIGTEGLAPNEPDLRKAQSEQLKAYLLFFEQLLANFLSQLSNIRHLYSYQDSGDRTYFTQALFQVPRVQNLLADFTDVGNPVPNWEDYVNLVAPVDDSHYVNRLNALAEDLETFQDRRKRFLDHLIARFNESFAEYAAYIFSTDSPKDIQCETLIADQERFLQTYNVHSHDRGTAFNYQKILEDGFSGPDFWNSTEVTGLKKRMTYLLGLPKLEREYISPFHDFDIFENVPNQWRFRLFDASGSQQLLQLPSSYGTRDDLLRGLDKIMDLGIDPDNYILNGSNIDLVETLPDTSTVTLARLTTSLRNNSANDDAAIQTVVDRLNDIGERENFHVIEHLLLRPRQKGEPVMDLRKIICCPDHDIKDPYSFRISVALPSWAHRFEEIEFRRLFKKIMRMEVPAHVYIHFYWIDRIQMFHFEKCWEDWLKGEWILSMDKLLQETDDKLEQEDRFHLLLERQTNSGEDGIYFIDCLRELRNLRDAYYTLEAPKIVDQYEECDLLAAPVDPDGHIIRAWILPDAPALPPGTCLDACSGEIRVHDPDALEDVEAGYPVEIMTLSSTGETTFHSFTIQFIPNGPAVIGLGPINQHIAKYNLNDIVVRIDEDPDDGPVIQADIIAGSLPPGMQMRLDSPHAIVEVVNENALVAGSYYAKVFTMDNEGGESELEFTIEILPDTLPVATPVDMDNNRNEDDYQQGDVLLRITDVDEGVSNVQMLPPLLNLADIGLAQQPGSSIPPEVEIYISDIAVFRSALVSYFQLLDGFYLYELNLRVTDGCTAVRDIPGELSIRKDTPASVNVNAAKNVDSYNNNETLAKIQDPADNGIDSVNTSFNLNAEGMRLEVSNKKAILRVDNETVFRNAVTTLWGTSGSGLKTRNFDVDTVDKTGGLSTVTVNLTVKPDVEATVLVEPERNQDTYLPGDVLATFEDVDGNGVVFLSLAQGHAFTLAQLGMGTRTVATGISGRSKGEIFISNLPLFRNAISNPSHFQLVGGTVDRYRVILNMNTLDSTGGKTTTATPIVVIRDLEGNMETVLNGLEVDKYKVGDVLFRFPLSDPNGPLLYTVPDLSGIAGVGWRSGSMGYEIYITDAFNANAPDLVAVSQVVSVEAVDSTQGRTFFSPQIELLPRYLTFNKVLSTSGTIEYLNFNVPLSVTASQPVLGVPKFGRLFNGAPPFFYKYKGFASSSIGHTFTFQGAILGTYTEQVEGEITISPQRYIYVNAASLDNDSVAGRLALGGLTTSGASNNDKTVDLARRTVQLVQEIDRARAYDDNPLLITNPKLIADYATGKKDSEVSSELESLTAETASEINRLQKVVESSSGSKQQAAREDLSLYSELYTRQVLTATTYASDVKVDDVEEDGPVQGMLNTIANQISKMK